MSHTDHAHKLSILDEIDAARETQTNNSDIEDALHRAFNMSSIAVTLMEKAFKVYEHYGDAAYHEKRRQEAPGPYGTYVIHKQDEGTLLFALYETHAQIREAWDLFTGVSDDDAPAPASSGGGNPNNGGGSWLNSTRTNRVRPPSGVFQTWPSLLIEPTKRPWHASSKLLICCGRGTSAKVGKWTKTARRALWRISGDTLKALPSRMKMRTQPNFMKAW